MHESKRFNIGNSNAISLTLLWTKAARGPSGACFNPVYPSLSRVTLSNINWPQLLFDVSILINIIAVQRFARRFFIFGLYTKCRATILGPTN